MTLAKVLCVLYDDPVDGYPTRYARDDLPVVQRYPDGQTLPTPEDISFTPGHLLGSVSGELGLREFLEKAGHTYVVTASKEGPDSVFERELPDADVVISQPFWPAYLTASRIAHAPNLKLAITVAEVTYCNRISVAEHVVMMILSLVRNYIPSSRSPPAASGWPCCAGSSPSTCTCTTPTGTACPLPWRTTSA